MTKNKSFHASKTVKFGSTDKSDLGESGEMRKGRKANIVPAIVGNFMKNQEFQLEKEQKICYNESLKKVKTQQLGHSKTEPFKKNIKNFNDVRKNRTFNQEMA